MFIVPARRVREQGGKQTVELLGRGKGWGAVLGDVTNGIRKEVDGEKRKVFRTRGEFWAEGKEDAAGPGQAVQMC